MLKNPRKKLTLLICILNIVVVGNSLSQHPDTLAARGEALLNAFEFESAIVKFRSAAELYKSDDLHQMYMRMLWKEANATMSLARYDQVEALISKALEIAEQHLEADHPEIGRALNILASNYYLTGKTEEARNTFMRSYDILSRELREGDSQLLEVVKNVAVCELALGNYPAALDMLKRVLTASIKVNGETHQHTAVAYNDLGSVYFYMTDNENALINFQKSLLIKSEVLGPNHPSLAVQYNNIGACYGELGNYKQSEIYLLKGMKIDLETLGPDHPDVANTYNNLGSNYGLLKEYDKMLEYYDKALSIRLKNYGRNHPLVIVSYNNLGNAYSSFKNYDKQGEVLRKALAIAYDLNRQQHPQTGNLYNNYARYHMDINELDSALEYVQKSIKIYVQEYEVDSIYALPQTNIETSKSRLLYALNTKGEILMKRWVADQKKLDLEYSAKTFDLAIKLISDIKYSTPAGQIDQLMIDKSLEVYSNALRINHELYTITNDDTYIIKALSIMEKGKAFQLLMAMKNTRANQFAGVPDSLVMLEKDMRSELFDYERSIARQKFTNAQQDENLSLEFLTQRNEYDSLIQSFESNYPRYFDLKYNDADLSLDHLKKEFTGENEALIEYMLGNDHIYSVLIHRDSALFNKIPKPAGFERIVLEFLQAVSDTELVLDSAEVVDRIYVNAGGNLFTTLMETMLSTLPESVTALTLIPDGVLNYLNFELLPLESKLTTPINYKEVNYMMNKYNVRYINSIAVEQSSTEVESKTNRMLAIAPTEHYKEAELKGAASELRYINEKINGDFYLGVNATEKVFKSVSEKFGIVHLATHGVYNDAEPGKTQLLFSPGDSTEDSHLDLSEIYRLEMNASLLVLSACNTGIGNFKKGEGIMSLSRAFKYAGCNAVIASLWQIPDESTVQVISGFYQELLDDNTPDEALRSAKLKYIESVEDPLYSHPLFWGGLVPIGKTNVTVDLDTKIPVYIWIMAIVFLILLISIFYQLKKKQSN